jgi:hypothetical protein
MQIRLPSLRWWYGRWRQVYTWTSKDVRPSASLGKRQVGGRALRSLQPRTHGALKPTRYTTAFQEGDLLRNPHRGQRR